MGSKVYAEVDGLDVEPKRGKPVDVMRIRLDEVASAGRSVLVKGLGAGEI